MEYKDGLYQIVEFQHVKPGKGAAFVRTKIKNMENGKVLEATFPAGSKVKEVRIERRPYQFLYKDDLGYTFMHSETYEQVNLSEDLIENADLMKEGQEVEILFHAYEELPLNCELPPFVVLEITYTEPGVKGDTATNTLKPATLETGAEINVPLFVDNGTHIKVDTRTKEYSERVNA